MKLLFLFFTFILADDVTVDLMTINFDDYVKDRNVLVEFFASSCGHCEALKPKWEAAAVKVNLDDSIDATIAKVDSLLESDLADRYGVEGYPTIKWFPRGALDGVEYDGGRETKDIVAWVIDATTPDIVTITKKQSEGFGKETDYSLVSTVKVDSKKEKLFDRACKRLKKEMKKNDEIFPVR